MKLSRQQLEQLISNTRLSDDGKDLYGKCPSCGQNEFGISIVEENNPFSCFRKAKCGFVGNAYTLLKFLGKTKEYLGEREINPEDKLPPLFNSIEEEEIKELPIIEPPTGWKRIYEDEYLRQRGFTDYQFQKFKVGRERFRKEYITFLVEMNGKTTGYISRHTWSKKRIDEYNSTHNHPIARYRNSTSDFASMLFGYDEIKKGITTDIVLVEGIFSKTKTDTNLDLDLFDEMKCCATFGAKISDRQIELLKEKQIKTIWLWFEADVLEKLKKSAAKLALYFDVRVSYLNGFDPGDIDKEQAINLLEKSMNWLEIDQNFI